jgi:hypothetical protein
MQEQPRVDNCEFILPPLERILEESGREDVSRDKRSLESGGIVEELVGGGKVGGHHVAAKKVGAGNTGVGQRAEFLGYAAPEIQHERSWSWRRRS